MTIEFLQLLINQDFTNVINFTKDKSTGTVVLFRYRYLGIFLFKYR